MSRDHWKFIGAPFDGGLEPATFHSGGPQEEALARMEWLLEERQRFGLVTAAEGFGKSHLAAMAVRRGARVVIAAPYEGPLRDATAGRAAVLAPRLWVPDEFGLCRYLAAGLAALGVVDPGLTGDLGALADELDAEALRNSAVREVFTNPAKALA